MTGTADFLEYLGAEKSFAATRVLTRVDLGVKRGEFVSLLGPSGCGKTTLLRIVAGLLAPDGGTVRLDGEDITARPPHRRDVGVVFQNYALFPHLTVAENVAFGLKARRAPRDRNRRRRWSAFSIWCICATSPTAPSKALSGGQQQRVAVARALAVRPKLLLLDEPFCALDRKLRETMQIELKRLLRELGDDGGLRHPRSGRGADDVRPHRRDEPRRHRAARRSRHDLSPARDRRSSLGFVGLSTRLAGSISAASDGQVVVATPHGPIRAIGTLPIGSTAFIAVRPERMSIGSARGKENSHQRQRSATPCSRARRSSCTSTPLQAIRSWSRLLSFPKPRSSPARRLQLSFAVDRHAGLSDGVAS